MYKRILEQRKLPGILVHTDGRPVTGESWPERRKEIRTLLENELFGHLPDEPFIRKSETVREENRHFLGGKAIYRDVEITVTLRDTPFSWHVICAIPKAEKPVPVFVMPSFTKLLPFDTLPVEEICDGGYGVCCFDYQTVTKDNEDFRDGLAGIFYPDGKRGPHDGGKIAIWAWAASRVLEAVCRFPEIDPKRISVVGHSRLGKTALWAGAQDERFSAVISVQSGCGGAALARGNTGEKIRDITTNFPFWFAPAYAGYADREALMPFDQHFLLALTAPRPLYVTSAASDLWADPLNEYLDALAVTPVYQLLGMKGVEDVEALSDSVALHTGAVGYSRRIGGHFFSREDWQRVICFLDQRTSRTKES